jgi:hypothetical protein
MPELVNPGDSISTSTAKLPSHPAWPNGTYRSPTDVRRAAARAARPTSSGSSAADAQPVTSGKPTLTLRETIAQAKAAAKKAQTTRQASGSFVVDDGGEQAIIPAGTFDFGLSDDPFNLQAGTDVGKGLLRKRIDGARRDGRLNVAAMGLKEIPPEVMNMYNFDAGNGGNWAECVDLTRFIAADNELESIGDDIFPDVDARAMMDDEESRGNMFGGVETLDLHGNMLKTLTMGLRRLEMLSTLNLVSGYHGHLA